MMNPEACMACFKEWGAQEWSGQKRGWEGDFPLCHFLCCVFFFLSYANTWSTNKLKFKNEREEHPDTRFPRVRSKWDMLNVPNSKCVWTSQDGMDQRTGRCAEPGRSIRKKHLEAAAVYGLDRRGGREPHRESVKGEGGLFKLQFKKKRHV